VGAPVTRVEARVVLQTVLGRWPEYVIPLEDTHRYRDISKFNGFERMPARLWP
jgi:cytochrome P450